jgi:peptide subunit release factor RF-3
MINNNYKSGIDRVFVSCHKDLAGKTEFFPVFFGAIQLQNFDICQFLNAICPCALKRKE